MNIQAPDQAVECTKCQDRGFTFDGRVARICSCQRQQKLNRLFKSSEITPAFRSKTFANFELEGRPAKVKEMYLCAKDYAGRFPEIVKEDNNWLAFLGEPGAGKTHLSIAVANQLLTQEVPVLYFQHVEGLGELKNMLRSEGKFKERLDQMKKVQVLIWDDLWKKKSGWNDFWKKKNGEELTAFEFEVVFEVLNYRYLNLLPTIISSEWLPKQLIEIDLAVGSRILERSRKHLVVVEGIENNYRLL